MAVGEQGEAFCALKTHDQIIGASGLEGVAPPTPTSPGVATAMAIRLERPCGVLFVDQRNDVLSQIAEGFARDLLPDRFRVHSAGTTPDRLSPWAIRVMAESGIDITGHFSKSLPSIDADGIDHLVVLESELDFPLAYRTASRVDWAIYTPVDADPPERDMLSAFRLMRDVVRDRVSRFCGELLQGGSE